MKTAAIAIPLVVVLALILIAASFNAALDGGSGALAKGGEWLLGFRGKVGDPGVPWIIGLVNERQCGSADVARRAREMFTSEFSLHPTEKWYGRLLGVPVEGSPAPDVLAGRERAYDDILLPVIYCRESPVPRQVYDKMFDTAGSSGYDLSHKLLALRFARHAGCAIPAGYDLSAAEDAAAAKMAAELSAADRFSDLFAEQAALLLYVGRGDLVAPRHIETIESAQRDDGGWADDRYRNGLSMPHPTALSVWALSERYGACPFGR